MEIGEVAFRVTPTALYEKAQETKEKIEEIKICFETLERTVQRTSVYWIGEAGELHRKAYQDQKDVIEEMLRRLEEHPRDLQQIAAQYEEVEAQVTELANELPSDVIS